MKPTMQEKEEALSVVQMLFSYGFKKALSYENYDCGYYKWMHSNDATKILHELNLHITCGASKVCIYSDDWNWVIKIGFLRATNKSFKASGKAIDYCAREAEYYMKAIDARCERYFAATYKCGEVDGVEIFLQEKVTVCEETFEDRKYQYISERYAQENTNESYEDFVDATLDEWEDEDYIRAFLEDDEDADVNELIEFTNEHDINDLHEANWGVTRDYRIVLIDFSGYM